MPFLKGHKYNIGRKCSSETKKKIGLANSKLKIKIQCICGKVFEVWPSRAKRRASFCSIKCAGKIKKGKPSWNKGLKGFRAGKKHHWFGRDASGEKNPSWKGGKKFWKKENKHGDPAYRVWREEVWKRDGFVCQLKNQDCSGRIEAHHIIPWRESVELRYELINGITLCQAHHPHKWAEEKRLAPTFQELVSVSS